MKKSKKNNKHLNLNPKYTPSKNIFGEKCDTCYVVLKKETALKQMIDVLNQLDFSGRKEFTIDASCYKDDPKGFAEFNAQINAIAAFKARLHGSEVKHFDCTNRHRNPVALKCHV